MSTALKSTKRSNLESRDDTPALSVSGLNMSYVPATLSGPSPPLPHVQTPFDIVTIDTTLPQLLCRIKYFGLASLRDVCFECLVSHLGGLTTCHVGANNEEFSKFSFDQATEGQDFVLQTHLDCLLQIIALRVQDLF